jgi:hypothetical protein
MTTHMQKEGNETLRVVIVDDDSVCRDYVARLLDMAGLPASRRGMGRSYSPCLVTKKLIALFWTTISEGRRASE